MIGFQPYETFQLLVETGGVDRANTLLVAVCDAFARRQNPSPAEIVQFETLATRLFGNAAPSAREKAALVLSKAGHLTDTLERMVIDNLGDSLDDYVLGAEQISDARLGELLDRDDVELSAIVARRPDIDSALLSRLFQMNSRKVYRALAGNTTIVPRGPFQNALARAAQMDHQVAQRLVTRDDFDHALLAPTFFDLNETGRLNIIRAFAMRNTPAAPIKKTLEQLTVANAELTRALMKLFTENRRPEVTRLLGQITGLDEIRCGQIAHDTSGAALFVVLRAFGCTSYDGLKVLIHATSHDGDRSRELSEFAKLFQSVNADSMAFLLSAWRGDVNLLDLARPEYRRFAEDSTRTPVVAANADRTAVQSAMDALGRISVRRAS